MAELASDCAIVPDLPAELWILFGEFLDLKDRLIYFTALCNRTGIATVRFQIKVNHRLNHTLSELKRLDLSDEERQSRQIEENKYDARDTIAVGKIGYLVRNRRAEIASGVVTWIGYWCGYARISEGMLCMGYDFFNKVLARHETACPELTFNGYICDNPVIGWDHAHQHDMSNYTTLAEAIVEVRYVAGLLKKHFNYSAG